MTKGMPRSQTAFSSVEPSFSSLKQQVYGLAGVENTKDLKSTRNEFNSLDFRRKASWREALLLLTKSEPFEHWRSSPPVKYREIFAEIDQASQDHKENLASVKRTFKQLDASIEELGELTSDCTEEANTLKEQTLTSILQERRNRLN